jgi:hypothetical protein
VNRTEGTETLPYRNIKPFPKKAVECAGEPFQRETVLEVAFTKRIDSFSPKNFFRKGGNKKHFVLTRDEV